MAAATLAEMGQIVIPAEIRARYELTTGTQVEFVDDGGSIRLLVIRMHSGCTFEGWTSPMRCIGRAVRPVSAS